MESLKKELNQKNSIEIETLKKELDALNMKVKEKDQELVKKAEKEDSEKGVKQGATSETGGCIRNGTDNSEKGVSEQKQTEQDVSDKGAS